MNKKITTLVFCGLFASLSGWAIAEQAHDYNDKHESAHEPAHGDEGHEEQGHDDHGHGSHEGEKGGIELSNAQRKTAGIVVETLQARPMMAEIKAPGEVRLNAYATSRVTPRIAAQVLSRHKRLGQKVEKGQPLVTLSSVEMAEAQGALLVADIEWRRVVKLGRKVVSEQRYVEAQVARQQAYARVRAYGMTQAQTDQLLKTADSARATGEFKLLSGQNGVIIHDDFTVGERVEPGRVLFEISDPSTVWVEARLSHGQEATIRSGAQARIKTNAGWSSGRVLQLHPVMDEVTRTQGVRIELRNEDGRLRPGRFVEVRLQTGESGKPALVVPDTALMRSPDGDWQLFIETVSGEFEPKEVAILRRSNGLAEIEGLEPGTRVVTQGAFFLQSELAKAGFEVHNH